MSNGAKGLVVSVLAGAFASLILVRGHNSGPWLHFLVYLVAILLSSGMKVAMPKSNGTMCVNFPFLLLSIVELSPHQVVILAACSVLAQCRIRVVRSFSTVQILFNVANVITATVLAWYAYERCMSLWPEVAPALAAASAVYFLANTFPVALIIALESNANPILHWRREFVWYFPFYLVGAALAAAANFIGVQFGWLTSLLLIPVVYVIYRVYTEQKEIVRDRERHIVEMEALYLRTIEGLAMAVEAKDKNTHEHLMRVRVYVTELGKVMGLDSSTMKALETASVLHDIGKLAVPEYIINKPGKLTREEFEKMKIHPAVGADILARVRFPYPVVPIVRSHHEAWDGSGYPDGLTGSEIPIGARILTAVDCFDALASDRPYRKAMPPEEAMAHLMNKAGQQFDPEVVALLERHYRDFEAKARRQIDAMAPLETEMIVERGHAPGAGFAPDPTPAAMDSRGQTAHEPARIEAERSEHTASRAIRTGDPTQKPAARENAVIRFPEAETPTMLSLFLESRIGFDCLAIYNKSDDSIVAQYVCGPLAEAFSAQGIPIAEGLSGWVAENRRPILNGNPTVEPNFVQASEAFSANSSALSVPLIDPEGELLGVLTLYSAQPAAFSKEHLLLLEENQSRFARVLKCGPEFARSGKCDPLRGDIPSAAWSRAAV